MAASQDNVPKMYRRKEIEMIYVNIAYRFGDRDNHSYLQGVYSTTEIANENAEQEEAARNGKYQVEIIQVEIDVDVELFPEKDIAVRKLNPKYKNTRLHHAVIELEQEKKYKKTIAELEAEIERLTKGLIEK